MRAVIEPEEDFLGCCYRSDDDDGAECDDDGAECYRVEDMGGEQGWEEE